MDNIKGKKVFVGISGGVDSAVTTALLVRAGAIVTGVFMKGWYPPGMPCTWSEDRRDAMRVAAHLKIPFITLDVVEAYKKGVIDYLISEYSIGNTPNPDIMCNKKVKFGEFVKFAKSNGADYIATGHYAQSINGKLFRGVDIRKDQSYFLWAIQKKTVSITLFPIGNMHKKDVRILAKKFGLPVAEKKDSQGVCFLGDISVEEFLRSQFKPSKGMAVDEKGCVVGEHSGAVLHTIGARISLYNAETGPWYVVQKNMNKNEIVVSKEHEQLSGVSNNIFLREENWFDDISKVTSAQYRYHGPVINGDVSIENGKYLFTASSGINEHIASGQSLVVYNGEECVGGGIIV